MSPLQPKLIAEVWALCLLMLPEPDSDLQGKEWVSSPLACGRNPVSKKLPLQSLSTGYLWGLAAVFGCLFLAAFTHQWCHLLVRCAHLWVQVLGLAARGHTVAFSLFGEWASRIIETSCFLFFSFMMYILPSQSLTDLFFPLHALMHCSFFQPWNTPFSCLLF